MSYDDNNGSWDFDRVTERDIEREIDRRVRSRTAKLDARGSVKQTCKPDCSDHEAMKLDDAVWSSLKHIGNMPSYDEPGKPDILELRNCSVCATTLARPIFATTSEALDLLRREGLL